MWSSTSLSVVVAVCAASVGVALVLYGRQRAGAGAGAGTGTGRSCASRANTVAVDGMQMIGIPEQKIFSGKAFPLVLSPSDSAHTELSATLASIRSGRAEIDDLLRKHKAILFRGFLVSGADQLNDFVEALGYENLPYVGGAAVRTQLAPRVFTANEAPSSEKIPFHHEMAQVPKYPTHLVFYAETPAETGGETPILPSSEVYYRMQDLHPEFMANIERTGVRYIRIMPDQDDPTSAIGRSWRSTFLTEDRDEAEAKLQELGSSWEWLPDGNLKTITATLPAVKVDAGVNRSNEKTFFNSMVAAYTGWKDSRNDPEKAIECGDGTPVDPRAIQDASRLMDELSVAFPWRKGDVLLVDNRAVMHSRRPFTGRRRVLASIMISPDR